MFEQLREVAWKIIRVDSEDYKYSVHDFSCAFGLYLAMILFFEDIFVLVSCQQVFYFLMNRKTCSERFPKLIR